MSQDQNLLLGITMLSTMDQPVSVPRGYCHQIMPEVCWRMLQSPSGQVISPSVVGYHSDFRMPVPHGGRFWFWMHSLEGGCLNIRKLLAKFQIPPQNTWKNGGGQPWWISITQGIIGECQKVWGACGRKTEESSSRYYVRRISSTKKNAKRSSSSSTRGKAAAAERSGSFTMWSERLPQGPKFAARKLGFDLPLDALIEIFVRLPTRSLMRLKCVNKLW